jgi:hypothetical protein
LAGPAASGDQQPAARLDTLRQELDAAAGRHGVTDRVVQSLGAAASAHDTVLVFDVK